MINYRECMLFSPFIFFFHDKILVKLKIFFFQFVILVVIFFFHFNNLSISSHCLFSFIISNVNCTAIIIILHALI